MNGTDMSAEDLCLAMRDVLRDERDAIRRLDTQSVTRAAELKEELLAKLVAAPPTERAPLATALVDLKAELQRNLVLLAHARDYLRDALELCGDPAGRSRLEAKL